MKIRELLKKQKLLTKKILLVNYHMNLLNCDVLELTNKIPALKDKSQEELSNFIVNIFNRCDQDSPNYDSKLDLEMTRFGMKTDMFIGGHCKNIWSYDTFSDDYYGFGDEVTSIYDDYIDYDTKNKTK